MALPDSSAVTRVLAIPELFSGIFDFLYDGPSLAACMRVNKLWAEEAAKSLWMCCGSFCLAREWGPNPIAVRHLAALRASNVERLQWYARFIRFLYFDVEGMYDPSSPRVDDDSKDESRFHMVFRGVNFSHLNSIKIYSSRYGKVHNTASTLAQYLQPKLKEFTLSGGNVTDEFFFMIKKHCPDLTLLELGSDVDLEATSSSGFSDVLKSLRFLGKLSISRRSSKLWSLDVFRGIAVLKSLHELEIPNIPDDWVQSLKNDSEIVFFPALKSLKTGLSEAGVETIQRFIQDITTLELYIFGQSSHALRILANFQCLISLQLQFDKGSVIRGTDLIELSRKCNKLECLQIPKSDDYPEPNIPFSEGITDATVNLIAHGLPKLCNLHLNLGNSGLTEISLLSLGTKCKHLEECYLSADVFFQNLVKDIEPDLFPALENLCISQPVSNRRQYEDIEKTAKIFVNTVSKLKTFSYYNLDNLTDDDRYLEESIQKYC